jgi:ribosomal protein S18 acetylase RimI-like enzyme
VIVTVRPFELEPDLERAVELGQRAREQDGSVEPFAQRLAVIASGPRALLELWRVAEGEDGRFYGLAFAAVREARKRKTPSPVARSPVLAGLSPPHAPGAPPEPGSEQLSVEIYGAVDPGLRRQGLGRQLFEPVLEWARSEPGAVLRARVRESEAGEGFLKALGFSLATPQLSLAWSLPVPPRRDAPGVAIAPLDRRDRKGADAFRRLSNDAWADAPDAFESRADELEQLLQDLARLLLLASFEGKPAGYLSAVWLGPTLAIEEVAVLPQFRRFGAGRALVVEALSRASSAILTVSEKNAAARALYKGLGFRQVSRRLVWEKRG